MVPMQARFSILLMILWMQVFSILFHRKYMSCHLLYYNMPSFPPVLKEQMQTLPSRLLTYHPVRYFHLCHLHRLLQEDSMLFHCICMSCRLSYCNTPSLIADFLELPTVLPSRLLKHRQHHHFHLFHLYHSYRPVHLHRLQQENPTLFQYKYRSYRLLYYNMPSFPADLKEQQQALPSILLIYHPVRLFRFVHFHQLLQEDSMLFHYIYMSDRLLCCNMPS